MHQLHTLSRPLPPPNLCSLRDGGLGRRRCTSLLAADSKRHCTCNLHVHASDTSIPGVDLSPLAWTPPPAERDTNTFKPVPARTHRALFLRWLCLSPCIERLTHPSLSSRVRFARATSQGARFLVFGVLRAGGERKGLVILGVGRVDVPQRKEARRTSSCRR